MTDANAWKLMEQVRTEPLTGQKKECPPRAEQLLAESGWLPRCLRTLAPAGGSTGTGAEQQVMAGEGEEGRGGKSWRRAGRLIASAPHTPFTRRRADPSPL
jgi:hypothetical protein